MKIICFDFIIAKVSGEEDFSPFEKGNFYAGGKTLSGEDIIGSDSITTEKIK